ncbi:MAG: protein kinase [Thioalkalispiraceae bacterium]|jgi:serine/threonine protein kinase
MNKRSIDSFDLQPGRVLARKYEVLELLGAGWEGEVYLVREISTGIERTAKLFFPQRNLNNKSIKFYAKKLHELRHCPIVIHYNAQETITVQGMPVSFLISEYVEGELLSEFIKRQPGKRLNAFQGLHLLHALAAGMECVHNMGEYHGDLHMGNIIVQRFGLSFDLKILDFYQWKAPRKENIRDDTIDMVRILYDAIGGKKYYGHQPPEIKNIICGLKKNLILKKFRSAGQLKLYLETMAWE